MRVEYAEDWYMSFEPGVREVVRAFHDVGVNTIMSCEGHTECSNGGLFLHNLYVEFSPGTYRKNKREFTRLIRGATGSYRWVTYGYGEKLREFFVYQTYHWNSRVKLEESKRVAKRIRKAWETREKRK